MSKKSMQTIVNEYLGELSEIDEDTLARDNDLAYQLAKAYAESNPEHRECYDFLISAFLGDERRSK